MEWQVGRWWLSVGTKHWHNAISLGGTLGPLHIHWGHFQFLFMFNGGKPHWPRFYDGPYVFRRVSGLKRWTAHAAGIQFWPIAIGVYWHATCHGCAAEYGRDYDAHNTPAPSAAPGGR